VCVCQCSRRHSHSLFVCHTNETLPVSKETLSQTHWRIIGLFWHIIGLFWHCTRSLLTHNASKETLSQTHACIMCKRDLVSVSKETLPVSKETLSQTHACIMCKNAGACFEINHNEIPGWIPKHLVCFIPNWPLLLATVSSRFCFFGSVFWKCFMSRLLSRPSIEHVAMSRGYVTWLCHVAMSCGYVMWLCHMAMSYGYVIWLCS
jgi:hypothetical protein